MERIIINFDLEKIDLKSASDLLHVLYRIEDLLEYKCKSVSHSIDKLQNLLYENEVEF